MDRCLGQVCNTHRSVAGVYSSNTFGAMAGALLVTFLFGTALGAAMYQRVARRNTEQMLSLLPHIGLQYALLVIPLGYLLCRPRFQLNYLIPLFVIIGLIGRISQDPSVYQFVSLDEGDTVVEHREGVMAAVTVVEDRHHEFTARIFTA